MEYEAILIQNSILDAYKLMPDDTMGVGLVWSVVVTCWIMTLTSLDANVRYMCQKQLVERALES